VVDARPDEDECGEVRYLLHGLAEAAHRGLDVRVLLAEVLVERPLATDINEPAALFLIKRGVQVRRSPAASGVQLHTKAVVLDDEIVIAGAHNWTPGAFRLNSETSLVLRSEDCTAHVAERFETLWSKARDYGKR